jgi:uncharacterized membrane protein YjfL (UPF0719 family)
MHILDNIPIRLALFSSIYLIILIFLAPFIDHLFTSLDEDKGIKENNYQILAEIIIHAMVLTVTWYFLHKYLSKFLESVLDVKIKEATKSAIDFISAIALVGLQRNLIDKLEYITFEHPFRVKDLYE